MKVIILGGNGKFGTMVGKILIKDPDIKEVALADINIGEDKFVSEALNSPRVICVKADVTDHYSLVRLIKRYDVVINFTAPYSLFGLMAIKASIEARRNYVDICNDINTIRSVFELNQKHEIEDAGISICLCCGAAPGLSNVLIKYLANQLDEVEEIKNIVAIGLGNGISRGIFHFFFESFRKSNIQYIDGQFCSPQDRGMEEFVFKDPIGLQKVYYATFAEIDLLPRSIKNIKNVKIKMCLLPEWFNDWILHSSDIGLGNDAVKEYKGNKISPKDFMASFLSESSYIKEESCRYNESADVIIVKGKKDSKEKVYSLENDIPPDEGTAITAYQVTKMLLEGKVTQKGVLLPDMLIDAEETINYWRKRGANLKFSENLI